MDVKAQLQVSLRNPKCSRRSNSIAHDVSSGANYMMELFGGRKSYRYIP